MRRRRVNANLMVSCGFFLMTFQIRVYEQSVLVFGLRRAPWEKRQFDGIMSALFSRDIYFRRKKGSILFWLKSEMKSHEKSVIKSRKKV